MQGRPHNIHHSASSAQNNQTWQQPRQTTRRSPPAATTPVQLQNRFQIIADELTVDEVIDALEEPMSDPGLIPPSRPKRTAPRRSPETETPKKIRVNAEVHHEFMAPAPRVTVTEGPRSATALPGGPEVGRVEPEVTPTHATAATTVPESPAPSPATIQRSSGGRLSLFQPRERKTWTWPSFKDDEDTAVLADWNGICLSRFTPATW